MWPERFPSGDYVRQARRLTELSQRAFAQKVGLSQSTIARIEAGQRVPSVELLERVLGAAELILVVTDERLRFVSPLVEVAGDCKDGAGRRYPAHLPLVVDPWDGEWWGDFYGLERPPETFHRDPMRRIAQREYSQWNVRYAIPYPQWPLVIRQAVLEQQRMRPPYEPPVPAARLGR